MLRLLRSIKQYKDGHQPLYHISLVILFWALADGIASFVLPVFMKQVFVALRADSRYWGLEHEDSLGF